MREKNIDIRLPKRPANSKPIILTHPTIPLSNAHPRLIPNNNGPISALKL